MLIYIKRIKLFFEQLTKMPFYAVARGRQIGIYPEWSECLKQVSGFPEAKFKKFSTNEEALEFIEKNKNTSATLLKISNEENQPKKENYLPNIGEWKTNILQIHKQISTTLGRLFLLGPENVRQQHIPLINALEGSYKTLCESSQIFNKRAQVLFEEIAPDSKEKIKIKSNLSTISASSYVENKSKKRKLSNSSEDVPDHSENNGFTVVYTDGACENNGRNRAKAGIGVWFGENNPLNISRPVDGRHTNNTAEIQAINAAITTAKLNGIQKLEIRTDSQFVINCMTKWIFNWKRNSWKTSTGDPVKNKEDLVVLDKNMKNIQIKWTHVRGHQGLRGNEEADRLAREGANK